jgi:type IV pilus assembly protein PilY1
MNASQTDWLGTLRQTFTKALVYLLCSLTAMPAWSASTLYQAPPFTSTEPPANVFMMLDDSGSMAGHSLPIPAAITINTATVGVSVAIQGEGADSAGVLTNRSWMIDRDNDWMLRSPALNPLWYNPANRYVPWNKDGTLMPNASIGGNVAPDNYGAFAARADATQLTERDPRQVPSGTSFVSITATAGRGLLGTDATTQVTAVTPIFEGRRVTMNTTADFRYNKMPFDFGPAQSGATTAPRNGHADRTWTTHNATTSPLDLFSRPLQVTTTTTSSGCFASLSNCTGGAAPLTQLVSTSWNRTNCSGTVQNFASDPGPLTCWKRQDCIGNWSNYSSDPGPLSCWSRADCNGTVTNYTSDPGALSCFRRSTCAGVVQNFTTTDPGPLNCGWTWTDCYGVAQNSLTDGTPVSCAPRIQNCNNTWTDNPSSPSLTCYQTRACANVVWGALSATNPNPPACWTRTNCSGGTDYISGANPGTLTCQFARQDCFGVNQNFATNPGTLTCYSQQTCAGVNTTYTSPPNPATLACNYSRTACGASTPTLFSPLTDPGSLTCYRRQNCDGTNTGWTATVLGTITCPAATEPQPTYSPSTQINPSSLITKPTTTFNRNVTGGGSYTPTTWPVVQTTTRTALIASTITKTNLGTKTVTPFTQSVTPYTRATTTFTQNSSQLVGAYCPAGTSQMSCTVPAPLGVPDPAALTPARYYRYTGGDKGVPASYKVVQIDRTRPSTYLYPVIDATTGVAVTLTTSQRSDCAAITSCTWLEEAQNYANWFLYYRNRLFAAQAVVADSLSSMTSTSQQKLRLGYGRINYYSGAFNPWTTQLMQTIGALPSIDGQTNPGALVRGVRPFIKGTQDRSDFFNWLFSLAWVGSTPNREAIDSVGRYFARTDNKGPWGATPGTEDTSPQLACRRNSLFLTTDGEWTNSAAGQPLIGATGPLAGSGGTQESDNVAGPTITGDGVNTGASFTYQPANWKQFSGGVTQAETLTDAAVYYWNRDLRPDLPNVILPVTDSLRPNPAFWQSMSTYVIGYGLSASMDTAATRAAVTNSTPVTWPTVDLTSTLSSGGNRVNDSLRAALASRGNFYAAQTVAELKSGVLGSFLEIATRQGSAGGVAVTGPAITSLSQAFFPSYTTGKWTGSLKAYKSADLESLAAGNVVTPDWTASLPAFSARNILSSSALNVSTTFDVGSLNALQASSLTSTAAGFSYTAAEAVNYLRGDSTQELPATGIAVGTKFRRRESNLGDIVNSTPLYVKAPDYGYGAMPTIGSSYAAFVAARRASTSPATVYVGANDGMFHAFDASTGVERFAYVPRGVYPTLANLLNPGYEHNYYVDGPVTAGDWYDGSTWRSMVIGTTGAGGANGGSSVFAIDVTNPGSITKSNVKWDTTPADLQSASYLGHILNRGIVGRINSPSGGTQWVYMVGNGYESTSNKAALLVFDMATGAMTSIPVGPSWTVASGDAGRNGMGGITVMYDSERNIKLVYGGDRQGNLWRFDFSSGIPAGAKGFGNDKALFSTGTSTRPISAAPRLVPHPLGGMLVIFGTGKLYDTTDGIDTASQGMYAIWDKPQYTAGTVVIDKVKALTVSTATDLSRTINTAVDWNIFMGWSAELTGGERIISDPTADTGSLTVTSYAPSAALDPCNGGGVSYVYRFNFATGIVSGMQVTGVVGAVTPLTIAPTATTRTATSGVNISSGISGAANGGSATPIPPQGTASQCRLYSTSIQGRPNVIAVNCPNFAPMRVWRQQVR